MRVAVSIALAAMVYPVFVFISWEPDVSAWDGLGRTMLVVVTLYVGGMAYNCPWWGHK